MRMWPFGTVEHRESATDAIVSALVSQASGSSVPPLVEALGAVEAAAGLWGRAFASATVDPSTPATMALTPSVLAAIGRGLAVRGEVVFELDVQGGAVELIQAASWKVMGGSDGLKADIKKGAGRLHIVDTTATAWGDGTASAPREDWGTKRLGASPPDSLGKLRESVRNDVLGAYGIPNTVFGSGGAAREAYRQFLASTIGPVSKIAVQELSDKLDTPNLALAFTELRAADIAGRARAYGVLIKAGMPSAEAAEATGLE